MQYRGLQRVIDSVESLLFDPVAGRVIASAFVLLTVVALVKASQRALGKYIENSERRYRLRKVVTFAGYLLAALLLTVVFNDKLGGLTVFFGVAGAGIAFALQEVIASAAGWVAMSFGRFYQIGDRVQLGGIKGDVIDIGVLRTTLMECGAWVNGDQYNGRLVRVANSFIFKEPVYNYSSDFPFLWDEQVVCVRYGSDYDCARREFLRVLDEQTGAYARKLKVDWRRMTDSYMLEDAQTEPTVFLRMTENWAEFSLRYVVDYKKRRSTRDKICFELLKVIENPSNGIGLGAPSFEVSALPVVAVNLNQTAG